VPAEGMTDVISIAEFRDRVIAARSNRKCARDGRAQTRNVSTEIVPIENVPNWTDPIGNDLTENVPKWIDLIAIVLIESDLKWIDPIENDLIEIVLKWNVPTENDLTEIVPKWNDPIEIVLKWSDLTWSGVPAWDVLMDCFRTERVRALGDSCKA
jgi:hypothetical protein